MSTPTASWIDQHARRTPDRVALVDLHTGRRRTYGDLAARVRALAHAMATRHGVGPGDRVAILSRNDTRVFETLYACAVLGAVAVPLNWRLTTPELTAIASDCAPALLVHESWTAEAAGAIGIPATVAWRSEADGGADAYEDLATAPVPEDFHPAAPTQDDLWTIIYTSGTTGTPKGVQITHGGALASLLGILVAHRVSAESRCLTVLPTFHVAGLNLHANPVLFAGGTVVVARTFDPAQALRLLTDPEQPVTHFCGVPANYQFMQQLPQFAAAPLRPFTAVVGGSPVPAALLHAWAERGVTVTTVFGITEAGACVTAVPAVPAAAPQAGCVGLPTLYARCRVRTIEGTDAAPGRIGELQLHGPLVTPGYWRRPDATRDAFTPDGWLRTGDAATLTGDGMIVLVDRWKDMYISGGENVYPAEVENTLHAHPAVAQAAVVGVPHPKWGETGAAFVVLAREAHAAPEDLTRWCREHLAAFKVPTTVTLVEELPRNATGKILKAPLSRRALLDSQEIPPGPAAGGNA